MAKFKSIVTDSGVEALTALIASGQGLNLTRAAAGSGVPDVSPNTLSGLINPEDVTANLAGKEFVDGTTAKTVTTSFRRRLSKTGPTLSTFTTWPSSSRTRKRPPCPFRWAPVPMSQIPS